ncbi:hypothetical protein Tco_0842104 [Tanacetum coccineum]|uniref:Uncharacterized protein n=1 Tax=Tanacetum coccineum TaxID=301880 RepID=A0ABQ5B115_9ASTR
MTFWIIFDDTFGSSKRHKLELFPESDPVLSSCIGSGSDESTSPSSLSPLGAAASVLLYVRSESDVDKDSWITFSDVSSSDRSQGRAILDLSGHNGYTLPTTSGKFMGVVSDYWILMLLSNSKELAWMVDWNMVVGFLVEAALLQVAHLHFIAVGFFFVSLSNHFRYLGLIKDVEWLQ